jgi:hypothetical protein
MTYKQMPEFQPFALAVQRAINRVDLLQASGIFYISPTGKSARIRPCARRPAMHIVFYGIAEDEQNWEQLARSEALGWGVALGGAVLALGAAATAPIWVPVAAAGGAVATAVTVTGTLAAGVGAGVASYKFGALIGASETGNKQAYLDTVGSTGLKTVEVAADLVALATGLAALPGMVKNIKHFHALKKLSAGGGQDPMQLLSKLRPDEVADVHEALVAGFRNKTPQMTAFFQRQGIHTEADLLAKMAALRSGSAASKAVTHYVRKHVPVAVLNDKIRKALAQELFNANGLAQGVGLSAQNGALKTGWDATQGARNGVHMHTGAMTQAKPGRVARDTISLRADGASLEVWWAIFQNDPTFAH